MRFFLLRWSRILAKIDIDAAADFLKESEIKSRVSNRDKCGRIEGVEHEMIYLRLQTSLESSNDVMFSFL